MHYFESLEQDLSKMGIPADPFRPPAYDYISTKLLVERVSIDVDPQKELIKDLDLSDLDVNLSRRALFLAKAGVTFDGSYPDCCEEAEPKLLQAIDPTAIENESFRSPIVVTTDKEPVGVIKRFGVQTLYGIEDVPEHNIVRGAFHKVEKARMPQFELPKSTTAWTTSLDSDESDLIITPVRFSVFNIPLDVRREMLRYESADNVMAQLALQASEEEIAISVTEAYLAATSIENSKVV